MQFVKVYQSLWTGSLRGAGPTQHVFIYLLGNCDENGVVDVVPNRIADDTGIPLEIVEQSILDLESPDPDSRTPDYGGRRIERLSDTRRWGWIVVNYQKYRTLEDKELRRSQTAERMRRLRERRKVTQSDASDGSVTQSDGIVEVEVEEEAEADKNAGEVGDSMPLFNADVLPTSPLSSSRKRRAVSRKALENNDQLPEGEITADQAFLEIFWPEYPRKRDREDALKAWKSLKLQDDDEETILRIMASLRRDVKEEWRDRPPDKIPYAATWLRKKGWMD